MYFKIYKNKFSSKEIFAKYFSELLMKEGYKYITCSENNKEIIRIEFIDKCYYRNFIFIVDKRIVLSLFEIDKSMLDFFSKEFTDYADLTLFI